MKAKVRARAPGAKYHLGKHWLHGAQSSEKENQQSGVLEVYRC